MFNPDTAPGGRKFFLGSFAADARALVKTHRLGTLGVRRPSGAALGEEGRAEVDQALAVEALNNLLAK
jgi:hypothetical protein